MRTPVRRIATLVAVFALAACAPGTVIVVREPAPPPPPPRPRIEPLEISLARPIRGHLIVQTNRPAYVALFEIVPDRGVALLAPANPHQRTWMLVGLNWVPVSWSVHSALYYGRPSTTAVPARWVYAIASDEPLRLPDEAFHAGYLRHVLGPAYRATNPYVTMRAISRAFVSSVVDEAWAEDAYAIAATHASDPYRTVRIYCANRTMYEVPEEMAHRAWCPVHRAPGSMATKSVPTRPDSVVASNGQRARRLPSSWPVRTPIDRVQEPPRTENAPLASDNVPPKTDLTRTDVRDAKIIKDVSKERRGNAYGHTDDPNVKGRGIENEKRDAPPQHDTPREPRIDKPVIDKVPPIEKMEEKLEKQEEKQLHRDEKQDDKEIRREEKQEEKAEKHEEKAEKHEQKADKPAVTVEPPSPPPAPEPEAKAEKQHEERMVKREEKADQQEDKADKKEEKPQNKEEKKPDSTEDKKAQAKQEQKEHKGKP
jgi:hypothetical protein